MSCCWTDSPYRRLVRRNDRPLPSGEEKKAQEKVARSIVERQEETVGGTGTTTSLVGEAPGVAA